jgi:hypothetical protein
MTQKRKTMWKSTWNTHLETPDVCKIAPIARLKFGEFFSETTAL